MLNWELRVHPNERELTRISNEWFARLDSTHVTRPCAHFMTSYKLLPPHLYDEWATSEFPLMAAMCYPDAPDDKLRCGLRSQRLHWLMSKSNSVCMDYISILFSYDDLMDVPGEDEETKYMHDVHGVEKAAQMLMRIFKKPEEFRLIETVPVLMTFHE